MMLLKNIRNFAIIAHIDHGKSTLADRLMELTGLVDKDNHEEQLLDRNPISRERGITIKLAPVSMNYRLQNPNYKAQISNKLQSSNNQNIQTDKTFLLNLVDTPGHVDFAYEVDRTLSCVEGVILLVDATQGIQAQTIAHAYKALSHNLKIIPVLNKIDRSEAEIEKTNANLCRFLGVEKSAIHQVSAKTGQGVKELLETIVKDIPEPKIIPDSNSSKALIFDSYYDLHRGVIAFVRVFNGSLKKGDPLQLIASEANFEILEVGTFMPDLKPCNALFNGQIGYVVTNLKKIQEVRVGDTMSSNKNHSSALPGYKKIKPMLQASIFPIDANDFENLKYALEKLYLTDASLEFQPVYSKSLGGGFRVGFLGLLHADVVQERLEREFDQNILLTSANVQFKEVNNQYYEPIAKVTIITPTDYFSNVVKLCQQFRALLVSSDNVNIEDQILLNYDFPLAQLMSNFIDKLKSVSSGFATLDWKFFEYRPVDAAKLELLINGNPVEEFSQIVVNHEVQKYARDLVERFGKLVPKQQYEIRVQAQYKNKILASYRISPFRKDVTAKLYGGDRSRKDKLLKKQKKGKKEMKQIGRVNIPKDIFVKLNKYD